MYSNTDYGPVQNIVWCSRTGRNYRAQIQLLNTNPSANPPSNRFELLEDGCSIVWDTGSAGMLAPVAPSKLTLKVTSLRGDWRESLGMLMGRPDGAVRCFIEADDNEDGLYETVEWAGYLEQALSWQTTTESGIRNGVTLAFVDGFGFVPGEPIFELPVTEADDMRYLNLIKRFLSRLAGTSSRPTWETIIDAIAYRPWVPDGTTDPKISSLQDPLWYLMTDARFYNEVFEDGDGVDSVQFTRLLASRFNARMYQSGGQWHIDQPSNIGRSASIFGSPRSPGRIRSWTSSLQSIADPGTGSHDIRRLPAARTWELVEAPTRAQDMPTQLVKSNYEPSPKPTNWVPNGGFEFGGTPDPTSGIATANNWETVVAQGAAGRIEGDNPNLQDLPPGFGEDNRWFGIIGGSGDLFQETGYEVVGGEGRSFEFSYFHLMRDAGVGDGPSTALGIIRDGQPNLHLAQSDINIQEEYKSGREIDIHISKGTFQPPNSESQEYEWLPEGMTLYWYRNVGGGNVEFIGSFEVTKTALWGDSVLTGNMQLDDNANPTQEGDFARTFFWTQGTATTISGIGANPPITGPAAYRWGTFFKYASGVSFADGTPATGELVVRLRSVLCGFTPNTGQGCYSLWDAVTVKVLIEGEEPAETLCLVNNEAISHGLERELPVNDGRSHIVGDGPIDQLRFAQDGGPGGGGGLVFLESATRSAIGVGNPSPVVGFIDYYPTMQGADTSWTSGQFQNGDPSTGGPDSFIVSPGIDCLCAEDSIRLLSNDAAGGQQLINGRIMLPSGDALHPHQVPLLSIRTYTATQYFTTGPLRVSYPPDIMQQTNGIFVAPTVSACIGGALEERNVESVQRQDSNFLVELETPFSEGMPVGTEINVHVFVWWTRFGWDLIEDTVDFQGQSIIPNDDLIVTHENIWRG